MIDLLDFKNSTNFALDRMYVLVTEEICRRGGFDALPAAIKAENRGIEWMLDPERFDGKSNFLSFLKCNAITLVHVLNVLQNAIAMRGGMAQILQDMRYFQDGRGEPDSRSSIPQTPTADDRGAP